MITQNNHHMKCLDCKKEYDVISDQAEQSLSASQLILPEVENEDIDKTINRIECKDDYKLTTSICLDCLDKYRKLMKKNLQSIQIDKDLIIEALENYLIDDNSIDPSVVQDTSVLSNIKKSQSTMKSLQQENTGLNQTVSELTNELNALIKEENELWTEINDVYCQNEENNHQNFLKNNQMEYLQTKANELKKDVQLSNMFKIEIKNKCAFINDFILSFSNSNFEEINFAVGQLVFLVSIMCSKVYYECHDYSFYSIGKKSKILDKKQRKFFDLYVSNNDDIMKFNEGLKCFIRIIFDMIKYINDKYNKTYIRPNENNVDVYKFTMKTEVKWSNDFSMIMTVLKEIIEDKSMHSVFNTAIN